MEHNLGHVFSTYQSFRWNELFLSSRRDVWWVESTAFLFYVPAERLVNSTSAFYGLLLSKGEDLSYTRCSEPSPLERAG